MGGTTLNSPRKGQAYTLWVVRCLPWGHDIGEEAVGLGRLQPGCWSSKACGGVLETLARLCECPLTGLLLPPQLQGPQATARPRGVWSLAELQGGQAPASAG